LKRMIGVLLVGSLWGGVMTESTAEMYKWTDANGETVYSQSPPPEGEAEKMKPPPPPPPPVESERAGTIDDSAASKLPPGAPDPKELARRKTEEKQMLTRECEKAKERLTTLESGRNYGMREEGGQVRRLSGEERERQRKEAKQAVDKYCK